MATTIYVSNTAINGIPVGNDTTGTGSISAPVLTITKGFTLLNNNDTLKINDGTYTAGAGGEASNFAPPAKTGLTVSGVTRRNAILVPLAGQYGCIRIPSTATGITIGDITVDGTGVTGGNITADTATATNVITINGTKFTGIATARAAFEGGAKCRLLTASDYLIELSGSGTYKGFSGAPDAASVYTIGSGSITCNGAGAFYGVYLTGALAGSTVDCNGIAFSGVGTGSSSFTGTYIKAFSVSAISRNHTYSMSGFATVSAATFPLSTTIAMDIVSAYGLSGNLDAGTNIPAGYSILIGEDTTTGTPNFARATIYQNTLTNSNHGYVFGCVNGGRAWGNTSKYNVIGMLSKGSDTGNYFVGNVVTKCTTQALYARGSVNDVFAGNTVIGSSGYTFTTGAFYTLNDGATNTTGAAFKNNLVYSDATITKFVTQPASQTATYSNNNYYSTVALPANPFIVGVTNYNTLAAWVAAVETTALGVDPLFVDYSGADYRLAAGSPMWRAGVWIFGLKDFRGRRRSIPPSIGAYEPSSGDPIQTTRSTRV